MTSGIGTTGDIVAVAEKMLRMMESDIIYAPKIIDLAPQLAHLPFFWRWNSVKTATVAKMWRQLGRQTLAMHPAVVEESARATSGKIPLEVLRAIPYMNVMVVYADPPEFDSWVGDIEDPGGVWQGRRRDEARTRLLGFLAYGTMEISFPAHYSDQQKFKSVEQFLTTTSDPDAEKFGVQAIFEIVDDQGRFLSLEADSFTLRYDAEMTTAEMAEDMVSRFQWTNSAAQGTEAARKWMHEALGTIVGTLMYLSSTTLDAEKVPISATRHLAKTTIARKPLSLYRVGWALGAAITKKRQERREWEEQHPGSGPEQGPQHRRAHTKVVWTGKGRTIPKTVLVQAYWTRRDLLGERGTNLVHKVPKVS